MSDWQPIETADKAEPHIVWAECDESGIRWTCIAEWDRRYESWLSAEDGLIDAKGWMPLPKPPVSQS